MENEKCVEETKLPYLHKRTSLKGNEKKRVIDLNMFKDIHNKVFNTNFTYISPKQ